MKECINQNAKNNKNQNNNNKTQNLKENTNNKNNNTINNNNNQTNGNQMSNSKNKETNKNNKEIKQENQTDKKSKQQNSNKKVDNDFKHLKSKTKGKNTMNQTEAMDRDDNIINNITSQNKLVENDEIKTLKDNKNILIGNEPTDGYISNESEEKSNSDKKPQRNENFYNRLNGELKNYEKITKEDSKKENRIKLIKKK